MMRLALVLLTLVVAACSPAYAGQSSRVFVPLVERTGAVAPTNTPSPTATPPDATPTPVLPASTPSPTATPAAPSGPVVWAVGSNNARTQGSTLKSEDGGATW